MHSRWQPQRERMRAILSGDECVHPATVWDPLTARIADELGFSAGMLAGSIAALAVLGVPDRIILTLTELSGLCRRVAGACELPIVVDGDHGYGNALNVMRMVGELDDAGIAAVSVEDTVLPEPYGALGRPSFISIEEGAAKMRAALDARRDPAFVILGRTTSTAHLGLDAAIERGRAYEQAGVDGLFFPGLKTREQVEAISAATSLPLIVAGLPPDEVPRDWLAARRVRLALPGHRPFNAALAGYRDALTALSEASSYAGVDAVSAADLARWSRAEHYDRAAAAFLGREGGGER